MRLILLCLVLFTGAALADASSDCYAINDKDKQRYCLASVKGEPSRCYSIQSRDEMPFWTSSTTCRKKPAVESQSKQRTRPCA